MEGLGRVNLLVGANNSGKTSVLEALYLLASRADPQALFKILSRRGELASITPDNRSVQANSSHLFFGHEFDLGSQFELSANNQGPQRSLVARVFEPNERERNLIGKIGEERPQLVLQLKGIPDPIVPEIPLDPSGHFLMEDLDRPWRRGEKSGKPRVQYVATEALDSNELVGMWNSVALTKDEDLVLKALVDLDDKIERIAPQIPVGYWQAGTSRSGFIVKHQGFANPIPIGSMGDGIWHILSLAISITQCRNGFLLVDEIDTGLHYTAMSKMWRMIIRAAERLDAQVFATTHSQDCVASFAEQVDGRLTDSGPHSSIVVQRIEKDQDVAIRYSSKEIQFAAERSIDLR